MFDRFDTVKVAPAKLASSGATLSYIIPLNNMPRLAASLAADTSNVSTELNFGISEDQQIFVKGFAEVDVTVLCQRCLRPFVYHLKADFLLGFVKSDEQIISLSDEYEPFLLKEDKISVSELVEDELILAIPLVCRHELKDCPEVDFVYNEPPVMTVDEEPSPSKKEWLESLSELKARMVKELKS